MIRLQGWNQILAKEAKMKARIAICMIAAMMFGVLYAADEELVPVVDFSISETPREAKMEEMTVAGFQVMNTMEHDAMMKVWGDFMSVVGKLPCDPSAPYYGVNFFTEDYNPQDHTGFGYMACAPVLSTEKLPEGVVARKIPARDYIVFEHKGPLKYLEESFNYIFYKYLPQSDYKALFTDVLEVYDCRFDAESLDSIIEIWMPVEPKE